MAETALDTLVVSGTFDKVGDFVSNIENILLKVPATTTGSTGSSSSTGITLDISEQMEGFTVISAPKTIRLH